MAVALTATACGGTTQPAGAVSGSVTVLAAASLSSAFKDLGGQFEKDHSSVKVDLSFAGSSTLVAQVKQGAPGDVFASADQPNMQALQDASLVGTAQVFARNRLEIVVGAGNPKGIASLGDLARPGLIVVLCAPSVPCGRYALQAFSKAGVTVKPASQEADVKAVVGKVSLGEADAGIAYITDVKAGGSKVQGVQIPDSENVIADYPIALLAESINGSAAKAFIQFVLSAQGQAILQRYGFLSP
jgi:molybdate transport system substrate-binding protein